MADPLVYQALYDPAALVQGAAYIQAFKDYAAQAKDTADAHTEQVRDNGQQATAAMVQQAVAMDRVAAANEALAAALNGGVSTQEKRDELLKIVIALIAKRVTTSTAIGGTTTGGAVKLIADAVLIQDEIQKRFTPAV
jgi:hypothetical protein